MNRKTDRARAPETRRAAPKASRSNGARRFRGLTCANCRARKIRCEGGPPTCKTCEIFKDECRYDKTPPVSQVIALARRLQEAEKELEEARAGGARTSVAVSSPSEGTAPLYQEDGGREEHEDHEDDDGSAADSESPMAHRTAEMGPGTEQQPPTADALVTPAASSSYTDGTHMHREGQLLHPHGQQPDNQPRHHRHQSPSPAGIEATAPQLSADEHGDICYYGPTSAVHEPHQIDSSGSQTAVAGEISSSTSRNMQSSFTSARSTIASHARESATWEEFALGNASLETGIPRTVIAKLLHLHWTWVSPMFMWVYRPAFVRDMATGSRYYSEFLLTVICAHAAKYQDATFADILLTRARRLLGAAVQKPSSIPTVQALLQLSARDLAHGSISQAWVYSGIAFRMASDLGLQHSGPSIRGLGAVDLEVRRRLFWSCYFWDKATSLYAGRLPAVTEVLHADTLDLLDLYTEDETWSPYYSDGLNLTVLNSQEYPPMKSHTVSCFVNSCRLAVIINDIIIQLYSRRGRNITEETVGDIKTRLETWRSRSPVHLKYDPNNLPAISPPPHIVAQNLLYYTTVILAHRPLWYIPTYYQVCIDASKSIEKLILLLESTFGLGNITYLMGYCIYTGASAILEDAKSGQGAAHGILRTYLRALNTGMRKCPLLERSLHIIVKGLNRVDAESPRDTRTRTGDVVGLSFSSGTYPSSFMAPATGVGPASSSTTTSNALPGMGMGHHETTLDPAAGLSAATHTNNYIPAFPYLGPDMPLDFDMNNNFGGAPYADSMAMLDCFPEMQLDLGELASSSFVL